MIIQLLIHCLYYVYFTLKWWTTKTEPNTYALFKPPFFSPCWTWNRPETGNVPRERAERHASVAPDWSPARARLHALADWSRAARQRSRVSLFARNCSSVVRTRACCVCVRRAAVRFSILRDFLKLLSQFDGVSAWMLPQRPRRMPERWWRTSWLRNARSCSRLSWRSKSVSQAAAGFIVLLSAPERAAHELIPSECSLM